MRKSKINYRGIGADGQPVDDYYSWEPCGYGCTANCDGCWARTQARRQRQNCPDCADFKIHVHDERLDEPLRTKKPGVVLTCFHGELFDRDRHFDHAGYPIYKILATVHRSPRHTFVFLTKRPAIMRKYAAYPDGANPNRWYGLSICNQPQADEKLPIFLQILGNLWLSIEPLWGEINFDEVCENIPLPFKDYIRGVIVGHDNRRGAPATNSLTPVYSIVEQCEAAGIPVFVKQIWVKGKLCRDPNDFPKYLRRRNLPWSMPKAGRPN